MEKRELIFQLSEAIRSDKPTAIQDFKQEKEQKIRQTEEDIHKLCKKQYPEFLKAHQNMAMFKTDLKHVRKQLGTIQENIVEVDKNFFTTSEQALKKQEELLQVQEA